MMRKLLPFNPGPHDLAARCNDAALQRQCIVQRLQREPATRTDLERKCDAPSVTKRISELRRFGWRIPGEPIKETAQGDLFETA